MSWLMNLYWIIRAWCRPGVIAVEPTAEQRQGWALFKRYPHEQKCVMCGDPFWSVGTAEVCWKRECYVKHKTGGRQ